MVFEQQPLVIVLYKLFEYRTIRGDGFDRLCYSFAKTYDDPSKFIVVESEQQYYDLIDQIKKERFS